MINRLSHRLICHSPLATPRWFRGAVFATVLLLLLGVNNSAVAQTEDSFGDGAADPVKLFERGQNAHAHGDLLKALEFYEEAIKLRPDFAEAEFQRGSALVALERLPEAEAAFRRAIEIRATWSFPYAALGSLLVRLNRDADAEPILRQAIKLDAQNNLALRMLAEIRLRAGDAKEALELAKRATEEKEAPVSTWLLRGLAERATGNNAAALTSLDHVLAISPGNAAALLERAEIHIAGGDNEHALSDLKAVEPLLKENKALSSRLAAAYQSAGKPEDAHRVASAAGLIAATPNQSAHGSTKDRLKVIGTPEEIEAANSDDPKVSRKALDTLLTKNPKSAMLLARLGAAYRTVDPTLSLSYYKRAADLEPANADYATGYSSALVQARRFAEAAAILRKVIAVAPNNYAAHANLATALYELKFFVPAIEEYEWLLKAKPDLTVAHYFIATAHDYLGEYEPALAAYESFLAGADTKTNQLEIEKIKLRLPTLRRQIQLGQGVKREPENRKKQ